MVAGCLVEMEKVIPKLSDLLHLGKNGLRLFAMSIKNAVVRKRTPQSRERFDLVHSECARYIF